MAIHRLTQRFLSTVKVPGLYNDGGGLNLQVSGEGGRSKSWLFRYTSPTKRKERQMGGGPVHTVRLAAAREWARQQRELLLNGIDPIAARDAAELQAKLDAEKQKTFGHCTMAWMQAQEIGWSADYAKAVARTLRRHVLPTLGELPIAAVDVHAVHKTLEYLHRGHPPSFVLAQQYTEAVLDWAKASGYRSGDNPAAMAGPLGLLLRPVASFHVVEHHDGPAVAEMPDFMRQVRAYRGKDASSNLSTERPLVSYATEFMIYTVARKTQAVSARFAHIDESDALWTVPPESHKAGRKTGQAHVVPLSKQAMAIVTEMKEAQQASGTKSEFLFPGNLTSRSGHLSPSSINLFVGKYLGRSDVVPHGIRSTFGNWSVEAGFDERDSEMALGHVIGNKIRNVYKRNSNRVEPRRQLLQSWSDFVCGTGFDMKVIPIPIARARTSTNGETA